MDIKVFASGSDGNAYRISDGKTVLLLEAGIPFKKLQQELNFEVKRLDGCFVTHCHKDHSKACRELLKAGVDIYTSEGTKTACGLSGRRIKAVKSLQRLSVGSFDVLPFEIEHDAPEPLGFLFYSRETKERLLYFTDTYYLKYKFNNLNYIMGECNYSNEILERNVKEGVIPAELAKRVIKSHMSLENFLQLLKANDLSKLRQIYLIHLSDNNSDAEYFKLKTQELTGAEVYIC